MERFFAWNAATKFGLNLEKTASSTEILFLAMIITRNSGFLSKDILPRAVKIIQNRTYITFPVASL